MNAPIKTGVLSHLSASSLGCFLRCPRHYAASAGMRSW